MAQTIEVIVRESGSVWPEWLNASDGEDRVVVAEDELETEEPDAELSFRVKKLLSKLARDGKRVGRAVVLVGTGAGNPNFDSRRMLSRALVQHLDPGGAELVFAARSTPETQQKLLSLVGALNDLLSGTRIDVSVRFCSEAPKPLVRSRPPPRRLSVAE